MVISLIAALARLSIPPFRTSVNTSVVIREHTFHLLRTASQDVTYHIALAVLHPTHAYVLSVKLGIICRKIYAYLSVPMATSLTTILKLALHVQLSVKNVNHLLNALFVLLAT